MVEIRVSVPDFQAMSDDEVCRHPLTLFRDGRWSVLSQHFHKLFGTTSMTLNEAWAATPQKWKCPACGREKVDLARLTPNGVILCQLDRHHDHLGDYVGKQLQQAAFTDVSEDILVNRKRACAHLVNFIERFAPTVICTDCNTADATMKSELGDSVHRSFSFSPTEIGAFVVARPNLPHEINPDAGFKVWKVARASFHDRIALAEQLVPPLKSGLLDREWHHQRTFSLGDDDARMFFDLMRRQLGPRANLPKLDADLRTRSCAADGHKSGPNRKRTVYTPSDAEVVAFDATKQESRIWRETKRGWNCACCSRSKREILRRSNAGKWTGHIHQINEFEEECDPMSLEFRSLHRSQGTIFASQSSVTICQDCRLILTDASKKNRQQSTGDDCLPLKTLKSLIGEAIPHARHLVSDDQLQLALDRTNDWRSAAADYWKHRAHVSEIHSHLYYLERRLQFALPEARLIAISDLKAEGRLPKFESEEYFDWAISEWHRFAQSQ